MESKTVKTETSKVAIVTEESRGPGRNAGRTKMMKAIRLHEFGSPEALRYDEVAIPRPVFLVKRRPGNKLWSEGWCNADNPTKTTSTDYRVDCLGYHTPVRATD